MSLPPGIHNPCLQKFFYEENSLLKWTVPRRIFTAVDKLATEEDVEGYEGDSELQIMLNGILPPRDWVEHESTWRQKVSPEPATRLDVIKLSQKLDNQMVKQDAKDAGICDTRRRLHTELLDEITRQIIIINPPLGLLLLRVRDHLNMTLLCYRALYENSVQFGTKKASEAEQGRRELEEKIDLLNVDKANLEDEKKNAMKSVIEKERKSIAEKDLLEALHIEQMEHFEKTNKAFREMLDTIMVSKMQ